MFTLHFGGEMSEMCQQEHPDTVEAEQHSSAF